MSFANKVSPENETFKEMGREKDFRFQALVYMGNASHQMAWANTIVENVDNVSPQLIEEMKDINKQIQRLQEKVRKDS